MPVTEWKEPALVWNGAAPDPGRPRILEIRSDEFIPQFLQAMAEVNPAAYFAQHQIDGTVDAAEPLKLYQPLHGCYYLVTASLVCRQLGLPDKAVNRAGGEAVFFVIRRLTEEGEEAWIQTGQSGSWQALSSPDEERSLAPGEERFPLHPVKIYPQPETPQSVLTDFIERDVHYGYIPTGNRDKYKDTVGRTAPPQPAADLVNDFIQAAEKEPAAVAENYRFRTDLFRRRVYVPWVRLLDEPPPVDTAPTTLDEQQLYILLELGDFLEKNLPTLWAALQDEENDGSTLSTDTATLFEAIDVTLTVNSGAPTLREALRELAPKFDLVRGQGNLPTESYDISDINPEAIPVPSSPPTMDLLSMISSAVNEETQPIQLPAGEDSELARLIKQQVQPQPTKEPQYHIRTVYVYDPECPPLVSSLPSQPFTLAKFFEPDAPARLVRLEAPSIKPQDLRKFARGVGIEMSPELHKLASCMRGGDMGSIITNLGSCNSEDGGLSIQMICTFSIQIIFLVAFIVMFIFLIALNFIFWWLAYLRICLPIPQRT